VFFIVIICFNWLIHYSYAIAIYLNKYNPTSTFFSTKSEKLMKAEAASDYARTKALSSSFGYCLKYADDALQYGGGFNYTRKNSACQMHTDGVLKNLVSLCNLENQTH